MSTSSRSFVSASAVLAAVVLAGFSGAVLSSSSAMASDTCKVATGEQLPPGQVLSCGDHSFYMGNSNGGANYNNVHHRCIWEMPSGKRRS